MNPDPYSAFLLGVSACRPASRGHIDLGSRDPFAPPKIHPNYLTAPGDMAELLDGVATSCESSRHNSMRSIIEAEIKPGPAVQSEAELIADIRQRCGTLFHPVGTCMMGPEPDRAVVDNAVVHGMAGLRVIDASIFPNVTSGNTNAPTIMVAEKGLISCCTTQTAADRSQAWKGLDLRLHVSAE